MENFGTTLKSQREKKGIRLEEIASITKIHLHNLHLLEMGQFDQLPPEPFLRGFIIAYAKYVGLDATETLAKYHNEMAKLKVEQSPVPSTAGIVTEPPNEVISQTTRSLSWRIAAIAISVTLVLVIATITYIGKQANDRTVTQEPSQPFSQAVTERPSSDPESTPSSFPPDTDSIQPNVIAELPANTQTVVATATPPAVTAELTASKASTLPSTSVDPLIPTPHPHNIRIEGNERTWVKVVRDEEKPEEFFITKDRNVTYKANAKIKIVLGNSPGAKVYHNGEPSPGVKYNGTIRMYLFPPDAKFPQDISSGREISSKITGDPKKPSSQKTVTTPVETAPKAEEKSFPSEGTKQDLPE